MWSMGCTTRIQMEGKPLEDICDKYVYLGVDKIAHYIYKGDNLTQKIQNKTARLYIQFLVVVNYDPDADGCHSSPSSLPSITTGLAPKVQ
jgi:hypothetical protein